MNTNFQINSVTFPMQICKTLFKFKLILNNFKKLQTYCSKNVSMKKHFNEKRQNIRNLDCCLLVKSDRFRTYILCTGNQSLGCHTGLKQKKVIDLRKHTIFHFTLL